jgi:hypothetical protein
VTENKIIQIKSSTNSCNSKGLHLCFAGGHSKCKVQWIGTEIGITTTVVITEPSMLVVSNTHCTIWHNQTEEQATNRWHRETHSNPRDLWTLGESLHISMAKCAVTQHTRLSHVQHLSCGCSCNVVHKMSTVTHFGIFLQFLLHSNQLSRAESSSFSRWRVRITFDSTRVLL